MSHIRFIVKEDLEYLQSIIESTDLFPSEMLIEMTSDYFQNINSDDSWLTTEDNGIPVGIAYVAPERMTTGTYNLYLIAIHKDYQGKGLGREIINFVENLVKEKDGRILIIETSGLPEFEDTRRFYIKLNYNQEAVIKDFYDEGEDKIVFLKKLNTI